VDHEQHEAPYVGAVMTYCRLPLELRRERLRDADAVILGAPFDDALSNRPGARYGPRAIRLADDTGWPANRPNMELGVDPFAELRVVDHGDVDMIPADLERNHAKLHEAVAAILACEAVPVVLGGDHSLSSPVLRALGERYGRDGYSIVHFDTHADTGSEVFGVRNSHGTPFYRGVEEGWMLGSNIVQVGLRGAWPEPEVFDWMRGAGFRWHTMGEIVERGLATVVGDAIAYARSRAPRTYLTVDVDVLDPSCAPGTGTPEPGGLTTAELLYAVRTVASQLDLCSIDVVEVSPPYDQSEVTALAAHRVVLEALGGLALRRSGRAARRQAP
jgi:agmatinase